MAKHGWSVRFALGFIPACLFSAGNLAEAQQSRLAYTMPGMDAVQRVADQVYKSLAGTADTTMYGKTLRYDIYLPTSRVEGRRGGVLFIHGGMVAGSNTVVSPKDDLPSYEQWGRLVAAAGLVGITFSHRLTTNDNADDGAADISELLATIRGRAGEWALDPDRLCVAVFSAGGPLASVFMGTDGHRVRCIALYYPFLDVDHAAAHTPFRAAHNDQRVAVLQRYSPRHKLLAGGSVPPILLARAGRDAIPGINASIDRFVQAALWVNAPLDFYIHPTGPHGFDMATAPDARAASIVSATLDFFRRSLQ